MLRWVIWAGLLAMFGISSTMVSRARNTNSYRYHGICAVFSHGTFFVAQLIGVDLMVEIINTHSTLLAVKGFVVYVASSTTGAIIAHWIAMRFLEKGNRRVGAYERAT